MRRGRLGVDAGRCVYVGDDERDIVAARAAGMPSVAALWGYRLDEDDPETWQADVAVDAPAGVAACGCMAAAAMSDSQALAAFLDKWRERWPEWSVAEVFVPAREREMAVAWFALLQELTDAAWGGSDPRPGEAKLGWWAEELHGWSQRRRRHPLGLALQPRLLRGVDWAWRLPALLAARERRRRPRTGDCAR